MTDQDELLRLKAELKRMRDRIEKLRGALKWCSGHFLDIDDLDAAEDCLEWAGDMEKPL